MRVVIIGSGNVATVLGERIVLARHEVFQVYGRNVEKTNALAKKLGSAACNNHEQLFPDADIYVIAVSDSVIPEIAGWLRVKDKLVVHTAGSVDMEILKPCSSCFGVLYPLQSIRKEIDVLPEIPLLVDGANEATHSNIFSFAQTISGQVQTAGNQKRKKLHAAAVIINNFSNYLYTLTADFCRNENLDFKLLLPLISETAERLKTNSPDKVQTGPAARKDMGTIAAHLELLENYDDLRSLYTTFTLQIMEYYGHGSMSIPGDKLDKS